MRSLTPVRRRWAFEDLEAYHGLDARQVPESRTAMASRQESFLLRIQTRQGAQHQGAVVEGLSAMSSLLREDEVELTAIRAQGPGGQNVNKVSSAVHLPYFPQVAERICA
jgi:hypothetical protein